MIKPLLILLILFSGVGVIQENPFLLPLVPQTVLLTPDSPDAKFDFETSAGQRWSFIAQAAPFETVNPMLRLLDSAGNVLLENDDENRRSTDARLEDWTAPTDDVYRVVVSLEGGSRAPTAGRVVLTALPGYSDMTFSADSAAAPLFLTPAARSIEMTFTVESFNTGFELRSEGWLMTFSPSEWRLQMNQPTPLNPVFVETANFGAGNYRIVIQESQIQGFVNGQKVIDFQRDLPIGSVSLEGTAVWGQTVVTIPFYAAGEGGLPPVSPQERLYAAAMNPLAVISELSTLGYAVDTGGLTLRVPRGLIETSNTGFSLYPLSTGGDIQNFVLSFEGRLLVSGTGAACGMVFRQVDSENFATLLFSEDGNLYILQYEGGELAATSLAVSSQWIDPSDNGRNWLVLLVQDTAATIFVNGRLAGQGELKPQPGALALSVFLNEPVYTFCT
ncbi:MAG: hypothetical protein K8I82_29205, partial [Anaerolineae bacterium]|nr:hypothetical protein [Anaerolineae bacterium]